MSGWRNQLNSVGNNAFDFVQRISNELATETPIDPTSELDYHKQKALEKDKELVRYQNQLVDKNKQIEDLTESVRAAYEEVELTRQSLLNRIAAKELELEKARYEIEALRDFQTSSMDPEEERNEKELILELELIKAEKAALSDELSFLTKKIDETEKSQRNAVVAKSQMSEQGFTDQALVDDLKKAEERIETLLKENLGLKEELTKRSTSPGKHESRINVAELEEIENQVDLLRQERDRFKELFEKSETNARDIEKLLATLSKQCQVLDAEVELCLKKSSENARVVESSLVNDEIIELKEKLKHLETDRENSVAELDNIRVKFSEIESSHRARIRELESELAETKDVSLPINDHTLNVDFNGTIMEMNRENVKSLLSDLEGLKQEVQSLQEQYHSSKQTLDKNRSLYEDVSELCKLLSGDNSASLRNISDDSVVQLQNLIEKERYKVCEFELRLKNNEELMNQQKSSFESITKSLEEQIDQANLAFLENRKKLADAESLIQKLENERSEAKNEVVEDKSNTNIANDAAESRISQLEELIQEKENNHELDKKKLYQLEKKNVDILLLIKDLSEGLREEYGITLGEDSNDEISFKIRNLVLSLKGFVVTVSQRVRDAEQQIREMTQSKTELQQIIEQNSNQLLHLHEENQYLRSQFNLAQDSVELLTAEKSRVTLELTNLRDELSSLRNERRYLEENTAEAELYKLHAASKIEKKQAELEEQAAVLERKKRDLEENKVLMDQSAQENEILKRTISGLNETIRDLQSAYVETDGKLKAGRMDYDNRIRELEYKLNANGAECEKWSHRVEELEKQNVLLEGTVNDLKMELEEYEKTASAPPPPPEPTIEIKQQYKMIESGFVVPPIVRQFIISAVTCDANKREESAVLLANIIGCTQEEKNHIEECFQHRGVWGLLRGSNKGPQNIKELSSKFIEFLEKETARPIGASPVENTEPIRIDNDIQPVSSGSNSDLKDMMAENN